MIVSRRMLIEIAALPEFIAAGWTLVYRCPGARRIDGDAAVIEWRALDGGSP